MARYSSAEVAGCVDKARIVSLAALSDIERAYIDRAGAPAAFFLLVCVLDSLGTLYAGHEPTEQTFVKFVNDFMRRPLDDGYDAVALRDVMRHGLILDYASVGRRYRFAYGRSELHLNSFDDDTTILDLGGFFSDVKMALHEYFARVYQETLLQEKLADWMSSSQVFLEE